LLAAMPSVQAIGQQPVPAARPRVTLTFERKGLPVPRFQFTVSDDGTAVYEGEELLENQAQPQPFRSGITISSATTAHIFALSGQLHHFNMPCASKAKNVADSGTKSLIYTAADGAGSCTFNYSENKDVQAITEIFQAIAETMDRGRELDHLHRFDRLGLDAAMKFLADEVAAGHALEVGTIAPSLHSIATDTDLMQRVRARAEALLALAQPDAR
jgi:hypothetical protein